MQAGRAGQRVHKLTWPVTLSDTSPTRRDGGGGYIRLQRKARYVWRLSVWRARWFNHAAVCYIDVVCPFYSLIHPVNLIYLREVACVTVRYLGLSLLRLRTEPPNKFLEFSLQHHVVVF